jgi:transcriptional regulator with XRE-family HTH domain
MEKRRQQLGMTWAEVATEAKITVETLRAIRRGKNEPSPLTKSGLERALRWQTGSIDAIYAGRQPSPDAETRSQPPDAPPSLGAEGPPFDLDSLVPQTPVERILKQYLKAVEQERRELREVRRRLEAIDEKLDRLATDEATGGEERSA